MDRCLTIICLNIWSSTRFHKHKVTPVPIFDACSDMQWCFPQLSAWFMQGRKISASRFVHINKTLNYVQIYSVLPSSKQPDMLVFELVCITSEQSFMFMAFIFRPKLCFIFLKVLLKCVTVLLPYSVHRKESTSV